MSACRPRPGRRSSSRRRSRCTRTTSSWCSRRRSRRPATDDREALLDALNEVTVSGANGDERGFNLHNHEGVVDDDVYFARFEDMTFAPVDDDPLSSTLPEISQVG